MGRQLAVSLLMLFLVQSVLAQVQHGVSPPAESPVTFDWRQVELRRSETGWQLRTGDVLLKEFQYEADAREGLQLIQELQLTQHGSIGTPRPVLEYWLSAGHAPRSMPRERHVIPFDPETLNVQSVQGQWFLRDARQVLFNFGPHRDDAEQALAMIRRYGFGQVGFIGHGAPSMMYFLVDWDRRASGKRQATLLGSRTPSNDGLQPNAGPDGRSPGRDDKVMSPSMPLTRQLAINMPLLPDSPVAGERVPFDWRQVQLRQDQGDWKLAIGSYTIANFGKNDRLARDALRVLQYYRFTEHCRIGQPTPSLTFFLVNGQPPRGLLFGVNAVPFRTEALNVQQLASGWAVCDGDRPLLQFADKVDEARAAVQVIQRYHFDHLCRIGDANSGMSFMVRSR